MFSATVPKTILGMTKKYQRNAVRVNTAAEAKQHLDITYRALTVASPDKENAIINVLRYYNAKNAIVFGDTRVAVNRMTQRFNNRGFSVVALSGELSQAERSNALQALRDGRAQVCIATDVAARGLDYQIWTLSFTPMCRVTAKPCSTVLAARDALDVKASQP